jgi:hypothetical protein
MIKKQNYIRGNFLGKTVGNIDNDLKTKLYKI